MRVTNEAEWERHIFLPPGPGPGEEGETLDMKGQLNDGENIAIKVASLANEGGGVVAFGAVEGDVNGRKMCISTADVGDGQVAARTIEQAIAANLWNIEPRPTVVPFPLRNGDRVVAVNVEPSVRLVAFCPPSKWEKPRYPVRRTETTCYLRPDEVERRILSYGPRAMQLRLRALVADYTGKSVRLVHFVGGNPEDVAFDISIDELKEDAVVFKFVRHAAAKKTEQPKRGMPMTTPGHSAADGSLEVPYEWIASLWWHTRPSTYPRGDRQPAIFIAARVTWNPPAPVTATPMPLPR